MLGHRGYSVASGWEVLTLGALQSHLSKGLLPHPQECLQRFGDSLQEMVTYHMVSPDGGSGGALLIITVIPSQAATPWASCRPRPAWKALGWLWES